jgi:hypothetical protein
MLKYSEAKAVDSLYAICIFGIGVFTPEQFSLKKLKSLALTQYQRTNEAKKETLFTATSYITHDTEQQ